jgi:hypothetical protein
MDSAISLINQKNAPPGNQILRAMPATVLVVFGKRLAVNLQFNCY